MRIRLPLRGRISLLVLLGALLAAAGVALLLNNAVSVRNRATSALASERYLAQVEDVELLVLDAETGVRGYLLTGHAVFLQPLQTARGQMPGTVAELERIAPFDRRSASVLGAAARRYLAGYVRRVLALGTARSGSTRLDAVALEGKRQVDAIRAESTSLEGAISARISASDAATRHSASRSIAEAIAVLVLLIGLILALGGALGHLAVAQQRARMVSERVSRTLQESMLPLALPSIPGCECASRFLPAAGLVGGDFQDVFEIAPGGWAIVVGDVCGKGAPAAALTSMSRWTLHTSLAAGTPPAQALRLLNESLLQRGVDRRFVTIACVTFSVGRDGADVLVACAGHPPPIVVPRQGQPALVQASGTLLGVTSEIVLQTAALRLLREESLVVYTDGLTDQGPVARVPESALAERPPGASAEQLCEILENYARAGGDAHRDDVAIVALRFVGGQSLAERNPRLAAA